MNIYTYYVARNYAKPRLDISMSEAQEKNTFLSNKKIFLLRHVKYNKNIYITLLNINLIGICNLIGIVTGTDTHYKHTNYRPVFRTRFYDVALKFSI